MVDKGLRRVSPSASLLSVCWLCSYWYWLPLGWPLLTLVKRSRSLFTQLAERHTDWKKAPARVAVSAVWRHCIGCEWVTCLSLSLSLWAGECSVLIGLDLVPSIQPWSCWGWDQSDSNHADGWSGSSAGSQLGVPQDGDVSQSNSPNLQYQVQA